MRKAADRIFGAWQKAQVLLRSVQEVGAEKPREEKAYAQLESNKQMIFRLLFPVSFPQLIKSIILV